MKDYGIFFDSTLCNGCRSCQAACKVSNGLPAEIENTIPGRNVSSPALTDATWCLITEHVRKNPAFYSEIGFDYNRCRHCQEANCITVCPVEAISRKDGWVIVDPNRCVSCGECVFACPFHAIHQARQIPDGPAQPLMKPVNAGIARKCDACHGIGNEDPACLVACPTGALVQGNRLAVIAQARKRLAVVKKNNPGAFLYGIKEFGGLKIISLYRFPRRHYSLPVQTQSMKAK